jgi:hypothetical protein
MALEHFIETEVGFRVRVNIIKTIIPTADTAKT